MKSRRREFLRVGAGVAAGLTVGRGLDASAAQANAMMTATFQFSGLMVHGKWPQVQDANRLVYSNWDVLMLAGTHEHFPEMRIPRTNIKSDGGVPLVEDRLSPELVVIDLQRIDLLIRLGNETRGRVTATTGLRQPPDAPCPGDATQYRDIAWLADFAKIYGDGRLIDSLKEDVSAKLPPLLSGRVRLSKGTISCAAPSMKAYDETLISYVDRPYPAQFTTDVTRFQTDPSASIFLDLVPMTAGGTTRSIELQSSGTPIFIRIENFDPSLAKRAMSGEIDTHTYWNHHFLPYHEVLVSRPRGWQMPAVSCCKEGCDPPFYCIPGSGNLG